MKLAVPLVGWVDRGDRQRLADSGPSLSLASTSIGFARLSSATVAASSFATGSSLTGVTVMTKDWVALSLTPPPVVPPLSVIFSVTVAEPVVFAAGVKVRTPVELTAGPAENRAVFVLAVTTKLSVWPLSFRPLPAVAHGLHGLCAGVFDDGLVWRP